MKLSSAILGLSATKEVLRGVSLEKTPFVCVGLSNIHKAHLAGALRQELSRATLLLTADEPSAAKLYEDIRGFSPQFPVLHYVAGELNLQDTRAASGDYGFARLGVLETLCHSKPLVVASAEAALQYTISPEALRRCSLLLKGSFGQGPEGLVGALHAAGYQRTEQVEGVCTYSMRGGIVDFYSPSAPEPVRVEFWGEDIDSMAYFSPDSQRRGDLCDEVMITPAHEAVAGPEGLVSFLEGQLSKVKQSSAAHKELSLLLGRVADGETGFSLDRFLPVLYGRPFTLLDYFDEGSLLLISDLFALADTLKSSVWQAMQDLPALLEQGICYPGCDSYYADFVSLSQEAHRLPTLLLESFSRTMPPDWSIQGLVNFRALALAPWGGELQNLVEDIRPALHGGHAVVVALPTERGAEALARDLREEGITAKYQRDPQPLPGNMVLTDAIFSQGFEYPDGFLTVFCHRKSSTAPKPKGKKRVGEAVRALSDLAAGDYVVHATHGIGVFECITKREVLGVTKDYIKIRYHGSDTLFVPVTQLDMVSKYIGKAEDGQLKLSRLGSPEWQKTRTRVRAAVAEMAQELVVLYKKRLTAQGHAFAEDNDWQRDFELRFPYDETDDQLRCIAEIKEDMQSPRPMDRLLCGDVGFGKTEVAVRAAFKCVCDSMQTAVLVPTTILAWQHFQTFSRRMEGFPIRVELLSRFRTAKQQTEILKQLRTGEIDIIIGTHRLLSKDVEFKNLGLCVIDEEQRFGVAHKERFKQLRESIDVLTLSATPIPRTLSMAMSGIRDMSIIEEAPQDRHPVQTYVLEHDWGVIAQALSRELRRGGQAFYLHNRVESIELTAGKLRALLPEARIAVAHGKMGEDNLSKLWQKLVDHEIDILVCTTIIETGVDVPNCNTLVIEDADNMGLSQLYQLRGRVGRSTRRAFAYLTFRPQKAVTEIAAKRLNAIKEFTSFGSGFRIAMRDMEIRGAGSVIGAQQHGHMEAVGYEMYLRLLSEAVAEAKGEPIKKQAECQVDVAIDAHIPEEYIESLSLRLDVYKKIAAVTTPAEASDLLDELIDRFGEPPTTVAGLVDVALLRNRAAAIGIREISQRNGQILFFFERVDPMLAATIAGSLKGRVLVNAGQKPYISVKLRDERDPISTILELLDAAEG